MKKINWKKVWDVARSVLSTLLTITAITFLAIFSWYYITAGSSIVVHDNGCGRVMNIYSQTGELLETHTGYIAIMRMDGDTVVYDWDGSCLTIQGAIVTVQDVN